MSLGGGFPLPFAVAATAGLGAGEKLASLSTFVPVPNVSMSAKLELAGSMTESLGAAVSLGLSPPNMSLQLSLILDLVNALKGELSLYLSLMNLAGPSAHFYHYHGRADSAGSDIGSAWSSGLPGGAGGAETIDAAIVATNVPGTWDAVSQIIKMVP